MDAQFDSTLHDIVGRLLDSGELEQKMSKGMAELEQEAFDYILECTPPEYSLWTSDRKFVVVSRQIWQSSRTLMNHSPVGRYHEIDSTRSAAENLKHLTHLKIFPRDLSNVLELIALVKYLDIPSSLRLCYDHFCHGTALQGFQNVSICNASLPTTCSRSTVLRIWELMCASPMRTKFVYQPYFKMLQEYNKDADFVNAAKNIMRAKYKEYAAAYLEGLPVDWSRTAVLAGIFLIGGAPKTALINATSLVVAEIFGNAFKKERQRTVRDFFLVYNRYVIYRDHYADVNFKNLNRGIPSVKIASNITQFLHKAGHLFLVGKNWVEQKNQIFKWGGSALFELKPLETMGDRLDFNPENNVLCYENALRDVLCLDFFRETLLIPCRRIEHGCVHMFAFYQKELFVWGKHVNQVYDAEGTQSGHGRVPDISRNVLDCRVVAGTLYMRMADGWHVYREGRLHRFCAGNQLIAFEEVSLNPYLVASLQ